MQLVELTPYTGVYVYQKHLIQASRKKGGKSKARYLLSCFYTTQELVEAGNLSGANNKRGLQSDIIDAIVSEYMFLLRFDWQISCGNNCFAARILTYRGWCGSVESTL